MRIKAVVFDLDDTLYPEAEYVKSGFRMCAKILKRKCYDEEAVAKELTELFDENPVDVFNRYIEKYGMTGRTLEDCVRTYRIHEPKINLSSEAASILAWLKENGILAGLLTDGRPEGQRAKIKALNLDEYMASMVITDELGGPGFRKPNPKGYDVILREMNVVPSESMYVGDNKEKDFLTPNSIGMLSVLYTGIKGMYNNNKAAPEGGTPQRTIRKLYELKDIIKTN